MKAMVLEAPNTPYRMRDLPLPSIEDHEVLVKIRACGICGTDLKVIGGEVDTRGYPRIAGHEPMGVVAAKGAAVQNLEIGDRVVATVYNTCGVCKHCRQGRTTLCRYARGRVGIDLDGGFGEYMKIPAANLVKVPDELSDEEAAILPCGVAVPYHALKVRAAVGPEDAVLVLGVGGVGIHGVQMARLLGAEVFAVDIDDEKLNIAKDYGASRVIKYHPERFKADLAQLGQITVIFDTVAVSGMLSDCLDILDRGGRIVCVGYGKGKDLQLDFERLVLHEIEVIGARGATIQEMSETMRLAAAGKIRPIVTDVFELSRLNEAVEKLRSGKIRCRAVVKP